MRTLFIVVAFLLVSAGRLSAQPLHILDDPTSDQLVNGAAALKVSLNGHGDAMQPGAGDAVGIASYVDDLRGRSRVWSTNFVVSRYTNAPGVSAGNETAINNFGGEPDYPGRGPRAIYNSWLTGLSNTRHVGSAAQLITALPPARWYVGIYLDQADTGIVMGNTMAGLVGLDMAQTRLQFAPLGSPPAPTPVGMAEIYAQRTATGKVQLIVRFADSWVILATQP